MTQKILLLSIYLLNINTLIKKDIWMFAFVQLDKLTVFSKGT